MAQAPNRRSLLKLLINFAWIAPLLIGLRQMFRFMRYEPPADDVTRFTLPMPPGLAFNPVYIETARVWLHQDDAGIYAVDAICTHLGCVVSLETEGFTCPCHGSRFTSTGVVLNGPATESLRYVLLERASDGRLIINRAQAVSAGFRLGTG